MRPDERRAAYACDITYGTNNELGFDYLRDNMAGSIEECVQRGHNFAIVDEVDSILIDEARTPLIISGPTQDEVKWYGEFAKIASACSRDVDYEVDEKKRTISVLEPGITKVEDHLGIENLYESVNTPLISFLQQLDQGQGAVPQRQGVRRHGRRGAHRRRAHRPHARRAPLQRRPAPGDRGQGGRHGPRGVPDPRHDHAAELLPPLREALRHDRHGHDRGLGVRQDLQARRGPDPDQQADGCASTRPTSSTAPRRPSTTPSSRTSPSGTRKGQPILVGTVSVEKSEHLSEQAASKLGVPHSVLNAKQHADEAKIVAMAGHKGAVTVATNMAGRGTDIMLGGSVEFLADARAAQAGPRPGARPPTSTKPPGPPRSSGSRSRSPPSTTRSATSAASTSSAPSGTSRAASTTSCAVVPAARATRASPGSTSRCRTS